MFLCSQCPLCEHRSARKDYFQKHIVKVRRLFFLSHSALGRKFTNVLRIQNSCDISCKMPNQFLGLESQGFLSAFEK
jgi:hypothetical protein